FADRFEEHAERRADDRASDDDPGRSLERELRQPANGVDDAVRDHAHRDSSAGAGEEASGDAREGADRGAFEQLPLPHAADTTLPTCRSVTAVSWISCTPRGREVRPTQTPDRSSVRTR